MEYSIFGRHVIADFYEVEKSILDSMELIEKHLDQACQVANLTVVGRQSYKFEPLGVTALYLLSESHISIHTYPEHGYCSIDCYTCGDADPNNAIDYLISALKPKRHVHKFVERGYLDPYNH